MSPDEHDRPEPRQQSTEPAETASAPTNYASGEQAVPGSGGAGGADAAGGRLGYDGGGRSGNDGRGDVRIEGQKSGPRRRRGRRRGEEPVVPDATFVSYYGRPVVKASPWEVDIPAYLFLGGLAGGSSLLAAGADLTGRPALRRASRIAGLGGIGLSFVALVHDLGKPLRFINMLRVVKPTSPMSVGTWILVVYGPLAGLAGGSEVVRLLGGLGWVGRLLRPLERPAGLVAAVVAPAVASYTAVLLTDTATPAWHDARHHLPYVFVGSAASAAGGLGMVAAPLDQAAPARRLALVGSITELVVEHRMEQQMGLSSEALHAGTPGLLMRLSKVLTAAGAAGTLLAGRSRVAAVVSGLALLAGSACTRFGVFEAGQESARDPRYTVVPQRERVDAGRPARRSELG